MLVGGCEVGPCVVPLCLDGEQQEKEAKSVRWQ